MIYAGYLTRGGNTIGFPFADQLKRHKETLLEMILKSGTVERKKRFILEAAYHYPEAIKFEPKEGKIAIMGKEFKQEVSEKISHKTQRYFDKKSFKKKSSTPPGYWSGVIPVGRPGGEKNHKPGE